MWLTLGRLRRRLAPTLGHLTNSSRTPPGLLLFAAAARIRPRFRPRPCPALFRRRWGPSLSAPPLPHFPGVISLLLIVGTLPRPRRFQPSLPAEYNAAGRGTPVFRVGPAPRLHRNPRSRPSASASPLRLIVAPGPPSAALLQHNLPYLSGPLAAAQRQPCLDSARSGPAPPARPQLTSVRPKGHLSTDAGALEFFLLPLTMPWERATRPSLSSPPLPHFP